MKKILTALTFFICVESFCQDHKWFLTGSSSLDLLGPASSLKQQLNQLGYNAYVQSWFGSIQYPTVLRKPCLKMTAGINLTDKKLFYITIGNSAGEVDGRKSSFYDHCLFSYSVWQVSIGKMSQDSSLIKYGLAPTLFLFHYSAGYLFDNANVSHTRISPGIAGMLKFPFGKEKRQIGIDFIMEAYLAAPVTLNTTFLKEPQENSMKVNLFGASIGIGLSLRK